MKAVEEKANIFKSIYSLLNPIPILLLSLLYYIGSIVSVIKNADGKSIFELGNEVALSNIHVLLYIVLVLTTLKLIFKIPLLNRFAKSNFWGFFAEPSKKLSIILVTLPFVLFIGSYVIFSEYKTNLEGQSEQKLFPTVDKIADRFIENTISPDKRIDRIAYKNVSKMEEAIEKAEKEGLESITVTLHSQDGEKETKEWSLTYLKFEKIKQSVKASKVYTDTVSSLSILLTAMLISASIALIFGLYIGLFSAVEKTFGTFFVFFGAIQPVAILPIIMIIAGVENFGKVVFIVTVLTTSLIVGLNREIRNIPKQNVIKALTLGASQLQVIYKVILPQVLPRFLNIMKDSFYLCWIFLLASEMISAESGLGYRIMLFKRTTAMDNIIGYVLWITILCLLIDYLIKLFNKKAFPWHQLTK
jgi:NitT/TauT family transport system permease protein